MCWGWATFIWFDISESNGHLLWQSYGCGMMDNTSHHAINVGLNSFSFTRIQIDDKRNQRWRRKRSEPQQREKTPPPNHQPPILKPGLKNHGSSGTRRSEIWDSFWRLPVMVDGSPSLQEICAFNSSILKWKMENTLEIKRILSDIYWLKTDLLAWNRSSVPNETVGNSLHLLPTG